MDVSLIRSNLGRVKIYYLKNESDRALMAAINALKEIVKAPVNLPADVKTSIREAVGYFLKDELVKDNLPANYIYQPSNEKQLLVYLINAYKKLMEAKNFESRADALARKNLLDQNINIANRLLENGKVSEADNYYNEALKYYKDEHRIFQLIGSSLLNAGQFVRAYPYFKRGLEIEPENEIVAKLLDEVNRLRNVENNS